MDNISFFEKILLYSGIGGYVTLILKYFANSGSRNILIKEVNYWHKKAESLEDKLESKDSEIEILNSFITNLKLQIIENKMNLDYIPLPIAILNDSAEMVEFNKRYSDIFLKPAGKNPFDYYSKTSKDFWGTEIGLDYTLRDLKLLEDNSSWMGIEKLEISEDVDLLVNYLVHKSVFYKDKKKFLIFTALKINRNQNIKIEDESISR